MFIIAEGDYGDIRQALGLEQDDTTSLSSTLVESGAYLPLVEAQVMALVPSWEDILDEGHIDYDANRAQILTSAVVLLTAGRLACQWFAARQGEEVKTHSLGPASVTWRDGVNWADLCGRLRGEAADLLRQVDSWVAGSQEAPMTLFGRSGPTRAAVRTGAGVEGWIDRLVPPIVKGEDC